MRLGTPGRQGCHQKEHKEVRRAAGELAPGPHAGSCFWLGTRRETPASSPPRGAHQAAGSAPDATPRQAGRSGPPASWAFLFNNNVGPGVIFAVQATGVGPLCYRICSCHELPKTRPTSAHTCGTEQLMPVLPAGISPASAGATGLPTVCSPLLPSG